jgi:acylphosphatase
MRTVEIIVGGRVQGVFYRQSTREKALELGLTGYVENLSNGSVRILASGEEQGLEALYKWCRSGPPQARVDFISRATIPFLEFRDFSIRRK